MQLNTKMASGLKTYLRSLSKRRNSRTVTADDAHTYLSRQGLSVRKIRTRLAYVNSTLRTPDFRSVGSTASERPVARGRMITEWRYAKRN